MIIFGWGKDLKQVAYAGIEKCPNCKNYTNFWICEHSSNATLYFVKVAKWKKKLLYMCETCDRGWEIEEAAKEETIRRTIGLPTREHSVEIWSRLVSAIHAAQTPADEQRHEEILRLVENAIITTVDELKSTYLEHDVDYVAARFIAYLQDPDAPH